MIVRTLIADHADLALAGLRSILAGSTRIQIIGEARNAAELAKAIVEEAPHVVLVDHTAKGFGAEVIMNGLNSSPRTKFVSISSMPTAVAIHNALRSGVSGYVKKDCSADEIVDAVLHTADGQRFFCGEILETIERDAMDVERIADRSFSCDPVTLTHRESEIIQLIAEGYSYTRIADRLFLSAHTVTTHRRNIMQKLGVHNTAAVVLYAVKAGLITPNKFLFSAE